MYKGYISWLEPPDTVAVSSYAAEATDLQVLWNLLWNHVQDGTLVSLEIKMVGSS
jgi:hypothetical protein